MTISAPQSHADGSRAAVSPRRGQLGLVLQELLTATVRLRSNRQGPADAETFRAHVRRLLSSAEQDARQAGYAGDDVRYALYACVAFLDESVLNSGQPAFRDWPKRPLQDELFGGHVGGEVFFQYLRQLLTRDMSEDVADVLEVYQLCLLLGFQGRYSVANPEELQVWSSRTGDQIARIRGPRGPIAPAALPPANEHVGQARDPWIRRLALAGAGCAAVIVVLFIVYTLALRAPLSDFQALAR